MNIADIIEVEARRREDVLNSADAARTVKAGLERLTRGFLRVDSWGYGGLLTIDEADALQVTGTLGKYLVRIEVTGRKLRHDVPAAGIALRVRITFLGDGDRLVPDTSGGWLLPA